MTCTPAIAHRARQQQLQQQLPGVVVSFTTVRHPPAGFPSGARRVALIKLSNDKKVLGTLIGNEPVRIGQAVQPRMRLARTNEQGLRLYEIAYEPVVTDRHTQPQAVNHEFPGYILALTGPSGVGKTTVSRLLTKVLHEYVQPVPILTTREPHQSDENEYTYIDPDEFLAKQKAGVVVASTNIPSRSNRRWYGYQAGDIEAIWRAGKIPVVVTEMHLLQDLAEHYGRRSILSCGLLPPGRSKRTKLSSLLRRLRKRGRDSEESMQDRILNARRDLQFFDERHDLFDHLLVNEDLDSVVATLKKCVLSVIHV